jgi:hypothetical protein
VSAERCVRCVDSVRAVNVRCAVDVHSGVLPRVAGIAVT